jgi:transposase
VSGFRLAKSDSKSRFAQPKNTTIRGTDPVSRIPRISVSSGVVEGLNAKVKLTLKRSYGFRTENAREVALYHALGKLPEPIFTHSFF